MSTLIRSGTVYDGTGTAGRSADVLIDDDGTVVEIGPALSAPDGAGVVDATGCWGAPGFIDLHAHDDAELEVAPSLSESLRHGVTTVLIGSCGLSMVVGEPEDMADMFCRVEHYLRHVEALFLPVADHCRRRCEQAVRPLAAEDRHRHRDRARPDGQQRGHCRGRAHRSMIRSVAERDPRSSSASA